MKNEMKSINIPEGWKKEKLIDITTVIMGQSPPSSSYSSIDNGIPFLQGNAEFGHRYPTPKYFTTSPSKISKKNDVLISVRAPVGDININNLECVCLGRGVAAIRPTNINRNFLFYHLINCKKQFEKAQQGSTFKAINSKDIGYLNILMPPIKEQQKIAEILTTVDCAIEETGRIISACEKIKKGLMQELLNYDVPPKGWKKELLTDNTEILLSNVDKKVKDNEHKVLLCNYMDVYNNEYITNNMTFMKATASQNEIDKFSLKKGDIIITKDSETQEDIAKSTAVIDELKNVLCGYHLALIRPNQKKINSVFLSKIFESKRIHNYFVRKVNGITRFGLNQSTIKQAHIIFPPLQEQERIAEIFLTIDKYIDEEKEKKETLTTLKKSLMQKLLTGEIRVKVQAQ